MSLPKNDFLSETEVDELRDKKVEKELVRNIKAVALLGLQLKKLSDDWKELAKKCSYNETNVANYLGTFTSGWGLCIHRHNNGPNLSGNCSTGYCPLINHPNAEHPTKEMSRV